MGYEYDEAVLKCFLKQQDRLFPEPVAETLEEAEAFLEDCMAVVCQNIKEVKAYFEEQGADIEGRSGNRRGEPGSGVGRSRGFRRRRWALPDRRRIKAN